MKKRKEKQRMSEQPMQQATPEEVPVVQVTPLVNINVEETKKPLDTLLGRSPVINAHLNTIKDYCKAMKPGNAMNPKDGAFWTQKIYAAMMAIINIDNVGEMVDGLDGVMDLFREHASGALNMTYTQRFVDVWIVDETRRDLFTNLCYIFNTYSATNRDNKKIKAMQIDGSESMLKNMLPAQRERLVSYLKRYVS